MKKLLKKLHLCYTISAIKEEKKAMGNKRLNVCNYIKNIICYKKIGILCLYEDTG